MTCSRVVQPVVVPNLVKQNLCCVSHFCQRALRFSIWTCLQTHRHTWKRIIPCNEGNSEALLSIYLFAFSKLICSANSMGWRWNNWTIFLSFIRAISIPLYSLTAEAEVSRYTYRLTTNVRIKGKLFLSILICLCRWCLLHWFPSIRSAALVPYCLLIWIHLSRTSCQPLTWGE